MNAINYNSGSEEEEFILEDEEEEIYNTINANESEVPEVNDLELIASYADIPVFSAPLKPVIDATSAYTKEVQRLKDQMSEKLPDVVVEDAEDESSSDSDSDSSSESEEEEMTIAAGKQKKKATFANMLTEEEEENGPSGPLRTKNEIVETALLYPKEENEIKITSPDELLKVGEVLYRIDHECVVVVQANYTNSPLNEGSVLCNDTGVHLVYLFILSSCY